MLVRVVLFSVAVVCFSLNIVGQTVDTTPPIESRPKVSAPPDYSKLDNEIAALFWRQIIRDQPAIRASEVVNGAG